MGEAKRRAARRELDSGDAAKVDRDKLARALRVTLEPIAEEIGMIAADCLLYANVGAETLRCLGMQAQLRTGDAA